MPLEITISAVLSAITLAARAGHFIYEKAFRSDIEYHEDYEQLRNAVREFAGSLDAMCLEYERANVVVGKYALNAVVSTDLEVSFLKQIAGDFEKTLQECRTLLEENEPCSRRDGSLKNQVVWNFVRNRVKELRERISFHTVRINQLLQPVHMRLALNTEQAVQDGFNHMDARFDEVLRAINPDHGRAQIPARIPVLPQIPTYLIGRFHQQERDDMDLPVNDEIRISSVMGHLANVGSLTNVDGHKNKTVPVQRYVDLMKATWILQRTSYPAARQPNGNASTTTLLVQKTKEEIEDGFKEFGPGLRFQVPSVEIMILQSDIDFKLWLFPPGSRPLRPPVVGDSEEALMEAALLGSTTTEKIELVVVGTLTNKNVLKIVQTTLDQVGRSSDRETHPIDLRKVTLIPTYAQIGAEILKVQVRTSFEDQQDKFFDFGKSSDLLRFQRCLTGFEVKCDEEEIETVSYKPGGLRTFSRMKDICSEDDFGRAQIWYHHPLGQRGEFLRSLTNSSKQQSTSSTLNVKTLGHRRKTSQASSTPSSTQSIDKWTSMNVSITTPSSYSTCEGVAQEVPRIEEPKVVVFITVPDGSKIHAESSGASQVPKTLSYFTFSLNENVYIDTEACYCHANENCRDLVVKSNAPLIASLYSFERDLNAWSLANLGDSDRREKNLNLKQLSNLDRVAIRFKHAEKRRQFVRILEDTRDLYESQKAKREKALAKIRGGDVVEFRDKKRK